VDWMYKAKLSSLGDMESFKSFLRHDYPKLYGKLKL